MSHESDSRGRSENPESYLSKLDPVLFEFQVKFTPLEHIRARLGEASYFVGQMESYEERFQADAVGKLRADALLNRERFIYCFLAFLSAVGAVRNYISGATPNKNTPKKAWRDLKLSGVIHELFVELRDFQTHRATIRIGLMFDSAERTSDVKIGGESVILTARMITRITPASDAVRTNSPLDFVEDRDYDVPPNPRFCLSILKSSGGANSPFETFLSSREGGTHVASLCREYVDFLKAIADEGEALGYLS